MGAVEFFWDGLHFAIVLATGGWRVELLGPSSLIFFDVHRHSWISSDVLGFYLGDV